jgi:DNA-binding transcriptional MerR regulator
MRPGELARLAGVSTDTLRHYERLGLLPRPRRTAGNYRDYPTSTRERVDLIQRALTIGFSLRELKPILALRDRGGIPCHGVRQALQSKIQLMGEQIENLKTMRRELKRIRNDWDKRLRSAKSGQPARLLETVSPKMKKRKFPPKGDL